MKKGIMFLIVIILVSINVYSQNTQWDFFKDISKYKKITLSGTATVNNGHRDYHNSLKWEISIDDKYNVSFTGNFRANSYGTFPNIDRGRNNPNIIGETILYEFYRINNGVNVNYRGTGSLIWDNDQIKIFLSIDATGDGSGTLTISEYRNNKGHVGSSDQYISASGSDTFNLVFDVKSDYVNEGSSNQLKIMLSQNKMNLNMDGDFPCLASATVGGNTWYTAVMTKKSESEINLSSKDEFGEWTWNNDKTKIILKSRNSKNQFVIWNNKSNLSWSLEMQSGTKGSSENTLETGDKLLNLAISIDGTPTELFSFIENKETTSNQNIIQLDYIQYNRFLGTMNKTANDILNQWKNKQIITISSTVNGVQKTDMFIINGLNNILEYLK